MLNQSNVLKLPISENSGHLLHTTTFTDGYTKVIRFSDSFHTSESRMFQEESLDKKEVVQNYSLNIEIKELGVSLVSKTQSGRRVEFAYLNLDTIRFFLVENESIKTSQLRIRYMQIDNQVGFRTIYPVMFSPKIISKTAKQKDKPFLDVSWIKRNDHAKVSLSY